MFARRGFTVLARATASSPRASLRRQALPAWGCTTRGYARSCAQEQRSTSPGGATFASFSSGGHSDDAWPCCPGHAQGGNHSVGCVEGPVEEHPVILEEDSDSNGEEDRSIENSPLWPQTNIGMLLDNNKRWVAGKLRDDPNFFKSQLSVHKPEYLFIGCSDARLSVQNMLGLEMGQLFVHRNVANQVVNTDLNFVTCLTYAVEYLKVENIIICGHYDCGGVKAAMRNHDHGIIEQWIMGIRDVARYHRKELRAIDDPEQMHRRMVELNVQEQALKLYANPVVQRSQALNGKPHIHALVFDVGEGLLKELDVDFKHIIKKYRHVYSMYNFQPQRGIIKPRTGLVTPKAALPPVEDDVKAAAA